jgi:putative transposase
VLLSVAKRTGILTMPNYRRYRLENRPVFVTLVTAARKPFLVDHLEELRAAFGCVKQRHPFEFPAWVMLPDHCHFIMDLPEGDGDFSTRINLIKGAFSRRVPDFAAVPEGRARRRERSVWQRRFWDHMIRDDEDFRRHLDYIHYNPVKHGYVEEPGEWPHSSFLWYVREGVYGEDWGRGEPPGGIDIETAGE